MSKIKKLTLAKYILNYHKENNKDRACSRCFPDGENLSLSFVCAYHQALDIVTGNTAHPKKEKPPLTVGDEVWVLQRIKEIDGTRAGTPYCVFKVEEGFSKVSLWVGDDSIRRVKKSKAEGGKE